jgi:hypothetical protein
MDNTRDLDTENFTEFKINEKKQNDKEVDSPPFWFDNPNILLDKNYIFEFFPIESIGDFEKIIIVDSLSKYCSELPIKFKKFIRDNKLNSIL